MIKRFLIVSQEEKSFSETVSTEDVLVCVYVWLALMVASWINTHQAHRRDRQGHHWIDKHVLRAHHSPASAHTHTHTHWSRYTQTQNTHPHMTLLWISRAVMYYSISGFNLHRYIVRLFLNLSRTISQKKLPNFTNNYQETAIELNTTFLTK